MKTPTCAHASREEPCWGKVLPTALGLGVDTCAGHYYVEATGGRYVAQGERHAFEKRIAAMRAPVECGGPWYPQPPRTDPYGPMLCEQHGESCPEAENMRHRVEDHYTPGEWEAFLRCDADLATLADLTED